MRPGRFAPAVLLVLATACSSQEEAGPPPATLDEQRALAEAESMIPPAELPPATPTATATESAADDQ
jgi:hypothetical protein